MISATLFGLVLLMSSFSNVDAAQGQTYVRYGQTTCPPSASLIYAGTTGSGKITTGGGGDFLCLPANPDYFPGEYSSSNAANGDVNRVEYNTATSGLPSFTALHGMEVPCAVCQRTTGIASIVIPGQQSCPSGLTVDYAGYLFAAGAGNAKSDFMCVDANAVGVGSSSVDGGMTMSPVEAGTGTASPYNYNQGYEITCVRCAGSSTSGALYTRWGRTTCPDGATTTYSGYMGGNPNSGGGFPYLCLSASPEYGQSTPGTQTGSQVYRTEYKTQSASISTAWNYRQNYDAPCVVCQAPAQQYFQFMQPGRTVCPANTNTAYSGYLMTNYYGSYQRSSYVCVDSNAETVGSTLSGGASLYMIQTGNGAAFPLAYTSMYEVTCSVCVTAVGGGSVFPAYGQATCPSGTSTLYNGQTGASAYTYGGGYEYLCLPPTPQYLQYNPSYAAGAYIYTVGYNTASGGIPNLKALSGTNMPCSLCQRSGSAANSFMYPAKTTCPAGYNTDYVGYIMSPSTSSGSRGQFVCLSASATGVPTSSTAVAQIFTVEGSPPIPLNYLSYAELSCASCSYANNFVPPPPPPPPPNVGGTTYVRWGRTTCPTSAYLVYVGTAAGPASSGNGGNMQCLQSPGQYIPGQYNEANTGNAFISKAEYYTASSGVTSVQGLQGQDVPCAVCKRILQESRTIMLPGRYQCPAGFSVDYSGYLFAPYSSRGEFMCMDSAPEGVGNSLLEGGYYISPVEAGTGAGAPAYYAQGYELTCVVCGSTTTGAVFTRWGRSDCPSNTASVYSGLVGGQRYSSGSGGSEYLCLSSSPQYLSSTPSAQTGGSTAIFRTDYMTTGQLNAAFDAVSSNQVPCAVCQVSTASQGNTFMQPGRATCPTGFTASYQGYLMSSRYDFARTSYICVDQNPQSVGLLSAYGALLYIAVTSSSTNTPLAYTAGNQLACAQCVANDATIGSVFPMYGSTTCPSSSTLVYSGQAGGSASTGGGADLLCLPPTPGYLTTKPSTPQWNVVTSITYRTSSTGVRMLQSTNNYQVPCALCMRPPTRSYNLVIAGATSCPVGFALDYLGFVLSAPYGSPRSSYICLSSLGNTIGSTSYAAGGLLSTAQTTAPLPAGYFSGYEMACSVCSGYRQGYAPPIPPPPPPPVFNASTSGAIYVRWGRTTCPSGATLVYQGYAAGAHSSHAGSGANLQCLPPSPQYTPGQYSDATNVESYIYRAEYYTGSAGVTSFQALTGDEVPCAVCARTNPTAKTLMVPGSYTCPGNFMPDYQGYLFSAPNNGYSNRGEYICMDQNAEGIGSTGTEGGYLLTPVEATTSGNTLFGYNQGYELTCVVCGSSTAGSVFTRWGRTTCPSTATLLYTGPTAGQQSASNGGGVNLLCMSPNAQYLTFTPGTQSIQSLLYMTQYQTTQSNLNTLWNSVNNYEVPCAVCQSAPAGQYSYVQHGSATCPAGFTTDYQGYIMTSHTSYYRSQFLCMDQSPETMGSSTNLAGANLYMTQTTSSTYAPLSYQANYQLACAHCTASTGGSVYVQWGKQTCPSASTLVHTGQAGAAGNSYGGGAEYMCLTNTPSYLSANPAVSSGAQVFAVQYETASGGVAMLRGVNGGGVPCAVCQRTGGRPSALMIPAYNTCPAGFAADYLGFLVSTYATHMKGNYVCLSSTATTYGPTQSSYMSAMWPTGGMSPLPPGYYANFELSCAVCSACSGDSFVSNAGMCTAAATCGAGQYASSQPTPLTNRVCASCPVGTYQSASAYIGTACTACSTAFQNEMGQSACKQCNSGYYLTSPTSQLPCAPGSRCLSCYQSLCPVGTYQSNSGASACISCGASRYQDEIGQLQCKACSAGYYSNTATSQQPCATGSQCSSCVSSLCNPGTYQPSGSQSSCLDCPATLFQSAAGATACVSCTTGYYRSSASAQAICPAGSYCQQCTVMACTAGVTYQSQTGQSTCLTVSSTCNAGQYQSGAPTVSANRQCTTCPSGTYSSSANTLPSCQAASICGQGTYQTAAATTTANTVCVACPTGYYQDLIGQTACKLLTGCAAGYYTSSLVTNAPRICSPCSLGINFQSVAGYTGTTCTAVSSSCLPGTYLSAAATLSADRVCTPCASGTYQDQTGQTSCKTISVCPAGTYIAQAATASSNAVCISCDGVTNYQNVAGQTSCKPTSTCGSTAYIATPSTTTSNRQCLTCTTSCVAGQYLTGSCGNYSNTVCLPCSSPCLTCQTSSSVCTSCAAPQVLQSGTCVSNCTSVTQYRSGSSCANCVAPCYSCTNATACLSCASYSLFGSSCLTVCPNNYYSISINNRLQCVACSQTCPVGTYLFAACAATADISCQAWQTCPIGKMESVAPTPTSNRQCVACAANTYQNLAGQAFCLPATTCQPGQYILAASTTSTDRSCASCVPGTVQSAANQNQCLNCPTGQYQAMYGQPTCLPCPADSYQRLQGQINCTQVPAGYSRSVDGSQAIPCPIGFACPGGASAPIACDGVNYYQDQTTKTACKPVTLCNAGQYQTVASSPTNNRVCGPCAAGTYSNQAANNATACTPYSVCTPGSYQSFNGSATSNVQCSPCPSNTYQDESGTFSCDAVSTCNPGSSVLVAPTLTTNRVCQACIAGVSYQPTANQPSCLAAQTCGAGTYQSIPASLTANAQCVACAANLYQNEMGQQSCKQMSTCQAGQYVSVPSSITSDRTCATCPTGTYQSTAGSTASSCTTATVCAAGSYTSTAATLTSNAACTSCVFNSTYQPSSGQASCLPLTVCGAGTLQSVAPTLISNSQCQPCPANTYQDASVTYSPSCKPVRGICPAGTAENVAPTPTNDRSCLACDGIDFYADVPGLTMCKTGTECNTTQYIVRAMTAFSDRVCANCLTQDDCRLEQVIVGTCNGTTATTSCKSCYMTCSTCNDTTAASCLTCISGFSLRQGTCVSECAANEYQANGRCVVCDGSCASCSGAGATNCTSCSSGTFLNNGRCGASCPVGTFANPLDNNCDRCSNCAFGSFASTNCTTIADTACTPWTTCSPGNYEITAPTPLADRICAACNGVTQFQNQAGQYSCKTVSSCLFPNVQGIAPTPTSDRLCICDQPTCASLVQGAYLSQVCAPPTSAQLSDGTASCCSGVTMSVFTAVLQSSSQYSDRHSCSGCTNQSCTCTAGYFQQAQQPSGSLCVGCDGVTGYAASAGATACSPISACQPGNIQTAAPTTSSNRVCSQCAAGTSDILANSAACTACPPGNYVPAGSYGNCSQFACAPGSANFGPDASTPCTACPANTFQPLPGQTFCNTTLVCAPGSEEFVMPSAVSNRLCRQCQLGYTFKAAAGSGQCMPVSHCGIGEMELSSPTTSSDRVCAPCPTGTFKPVAGDTNCTAVSVCAAGQEEVRMPTAISDRTCRGCTVGVAFNPTAGSGTCQAVTPCSSTTYESVPPTASSDRTCTALTTCSGAEYQVVAPTTTSNRVCSPCTSCPSGRFQISPCWALQNAQCQGCDSCVTGQYQTMACTVTDNTACSNCSVCPTSYYQTSACTSVSNTLCQAVRRCDYYQFIAVAATAVSDAVCQNYTQCGPNQYVFKRETTTSDLICRDLTVCLPGQYPTVSPGPYTDRQCTPCSAGFSDVTSTGAYCQKCQAGTSVPVGSSGPCSQFLCSPGTMDPDGDSSTPCVSCNYTATYQGQAGMTSCLPVAQCGPGYQEVAAPTLYTNRVCQMCFAGFTFKATSGSADSCAFVRQCVAGAEYMSVPPTISSDRVCTPLTQCSSASQYESVPPTPTSDRVCNNTTQCTPDMLYQSVAATATTDRRCTPYSNCSMLQYQSVAPTPTSDRSCPQTTVCSLPMYEVVAPTATSNRQCNTSYGTVLYYAGDFDSLVSTPEQQATFIAAFNDTAVSQGMSPSAMIGATLQRGSILLTAYMTNATMRPWLYTQLMAGNLTVMGLSAMLCPSNLFLVLPFNPYTGTVRCDAVSQCNDNQWRSVAPTLTSDAVCLPLTLCVATATQPTPTSDRVCAIIGASGAGSSSGSGLPVAVIAIVIVLIVVVAVLVIGMLIIYRKRRRDKAQRDSAFMAANDREATRTLRDGNMMLAALNSGGTMQYNNPIFAKSGEGYLDIAPTPEWMAGQMTREQAEAVLSPGVIGGFLVRASSATGCFVLSMKIAEGQYEHHRLQQTGNNFTLNGKPLSKQCPTIYDVLDHLSQEPDGISICIAYSAGNSYGVKKEEPPARVGGAGARPNSDIFYGAHEQQQQQEMYGAKEAPQPPWLVQMNRKQATDLLLEHPTRGHFVIRESESKPGNYAISVVLSAREVEHHTLVPGPDGNFRLNDKPMAKKCSTLEEVVQHLSEKRETMSTVLSLDQYPQVELSDMYTTVRTEGRMQYSVPASTGVNTSAGPIGNPTYFDLPDDTSNYSHLTPINVPGGIPEYFVPASTAGLSAPSKPRTEYVEYQIPNALCTDGYLSVDGAGAGVGVAGAGVAGVGVAGVPVIHSDSAVHSYENVDPAAMRRKRETAA